MLAILFGRGLSLSFSLLRFCPLTDAVVTATLALILFAIPVVVAVVNRKRFTLLNLPGRLEDHSPLSRESHVLENCTSIARVVNLARPIAGELRIYLADISIRRACLAEVVTIEICRKVVFILIRWGNFSKQLCDDISGVVVSRCLKTVANQLSVHNVWNLLANERVDTIADRF